MRSKRELELAIDEGRGIRMDDGTLVTSLDDLEDYLSLSSSNDDDEGANSGDLSKMNLPSLRSLPEAETLPPNLKKADLIAAIQMIRDQKAAEENA